MGTTATVAAVRGAHLVIAQVGDSRAYVLRRRELVQATRDDTLLNEAVRTGSATLGDAAFFPYRKVLLQALGTGVAPKVGVTVVSACLGDVLLLCTDGVHGGLDDAVLRATLLRHPEPGVAARVFVHQALASGGSDNLALVVARFDGEKLRPPAASDVVEDRSARPRA
jgi:protein phosphatase